MKRSYIFLVFFSSLILAIVVIYIFPKPSNNRDWVHYLSRLTTTTIEETQITLINVRDWEYKPQEIVSKQWISEVTIDTKNLTGVWFVVVPFGKLDVVGHTFLTFEFTDGSAYSFSIEARRENGEDYSTIQGLFNTYELAYTWGTERDFLTRRVLLHQDPLRMYKLELTLEQAQKLLSTLAVETNKLASTPRFYNTLTSNCTNTLARAINNNYPNTIPYSLTWNFPGNSDLFLMKEGFIAHTEPKDIFQKKHTLSPYDTAIEDAASLAATEFSLKIREQFDLY